VTTKVKLHDESQLDFPHAALSVNLKAITIVFCGVYENESVSITFWQ